MFLGTNSSGSLGPNAEPVPPPAATPQECPWRGGGWSCALPGDSVARGDLKESSSSASARG